MVRDAACAPALSAEEPADLDAGGLALILATLGPLHEKRAREHVYRSRRSPALSPAFPIDTANLRS